MRFLNDFYRLEVCEFIHEIDQKNTTFCNKVVISTLTSYSFFLSFSRLICSIFGHNFCRVHVEIFKTTKAFNHFLWYDNT
ncbi:hypothetical protein JS80_07600 [Anoxybacillus sp. KU2-6(11)]|nr:hypothetical protein JS80_07600 [Anoxybacillus sp. KU2-6(11)]